MRPSAALRSSAGTPSWRCSPNLLGGEKRQGVLLVGPELAGKSELLYAWLRAERKAGRERRVYATSGSRLIAGMSGFGQWQERVLRVMRAAQELDAILYFENLGELLAQHSTESIDLPGAMKPFLEEGKVRFLGELAPESLDLLESRHPGLFATLTARAPGAAGARRPPARPCAPGWPGSERRSPRGPPWPTTRWSRWWSWPSATSPAARCPARPLRLYEEMRAGLQQERTG